LPLVTIMAMVGCSADRVKADATTKWPSRRAFNYDWQL
jgi:hypothetical protein